MSEFTDGQYDDGYNDDALEAAVNENKEKLYSFMQTEPYKKWIGTSDEETKQFDAMMKHYCGEGNYDPNISTPNRFWSQAEIKDYFCPDRQSEENFDVYMLI